MSKREFLEGCKFRDPCKSEKPVEKWDVYAEKQFNPKVKVTNWWYCREGFPKDNDDMVQATYNRLGTWKEDESHWMTETKWAMQEGRGDPQLLARQAAVKPLRLLTFLSYPITLYEKKIHSAVSSSSPKSLKRLCRVINPISNDKNSVARKQQRLKSWVPARVLHHHSLNMGAVKRAIGLITGSDPFRKHLRHMSLFQGDSVSRLCGEDEETEKHILFSCPELEHRRNHIFNANSRTIANNTTPDIGHKILELTRVKPLKH